MAPNSRVLCNRQHERSQRIHLSMPLWSMMTGLPTRERKCAPRLAVSPSTVQRRPEKTTLNQLQTTPGRLSSTPTTAEFSPSPSLFSGQIRAESIGRARAEGKFDVKSLSQARRPRPLIGFPIPSFSPFPERYWCRKKGPKMSLEASHLTVARGDGQWAEGNVSGQDCCTQ
ncbi:uncharacterized protein AKAW2_60741A [Aspergillus luchuensis]|uniref:Uncharacterized protein n=1 Tax=Aspergillus kawachii TaxID=1069201 RepID=A0A7R7WGC3_ASPKA|nr:uncharacterized protein AKAW2_60741A [Aspergillus luchuensis]BCS02477.1 hypothetical protein AKAW2_60741A [Aspergillus luchuensis]